MDEMEIVRRIYQIFYTMRKDGMKMFDENHVHEMSSRDMMILDVLAQSGDMLKMSELSQHFNITPPAISQIIRSLEEKHWIERVVRKEDRRSVYIKLSIEGSQVMKQCEKRMIDKLTDFIDYLGEDDAQTMLRILEKSKNYFYEKSRVK